MGGGGDRCRVYVSIQLHTRTDLGTRVHTRTRTDTRFDGRSVKFTLTCIAQSKSDRQDVRN